MRGYTGNLNNLLYLQQSVAWRKFPSFFVTISHNFRCLDGTDCCCCFPFTSLRSKAWARAPKFKTNGKCCRPKNRCRGKRRWLSRVRRDRNHFPRLIPDDGHVSPVASCVASPLELCQFLKIRNRELHFCLPFPEIRNYKSINNSFSIPFLFQFQFQFQINWW